VGEEQVRLGDGNVGERCGTLGDEDEADAGAPPAGEQAPEGRIGDAVEEGVGLVDEQPRQALAVAVDARTITPRGRRPDDRAGRRRRQPRTVEDGDRAVEQSRRIVVEHAPRTGHPEVVPGCAAGAGRDVGGVDERTHFGERVAGVGRTPDQTPCGAGRIQPQEIRPRPRRERVGRQGGVDCLGVDRVSLRQARERAHRIDHQGRESLDAGEFLGEDAQRVRLPGAALADHERRVGTAQVDAHRPAGAPVAGAIAPEPSRRTADAVASEYVHRRDCPPHRT
jgi:hypothetical protein